MRSHAQISDSDSDSSDDEAEVQLNGFYNPWESGMNKDGYTRALPAYFSAGSDDLFMRSMLNNYALEGKACDDDGVCKPTGSFWMNAAGARAVSQEVLASHKGLSGAALKTYLDTYFDKAWAHFDVNKSGTIEAVKMPQFMRFLASDQRLSLGEFF